MIAPRVWQVGLLLLIGATAALIMWTAASLMAAGGHGLDIGFTLSFPFSEILHRIHPGAPNAWLLGLIGWVQWPIYCLIIGLAWSKGHRTLVCFGVLALHLIAVACCFFPKSFYESFW
jgi:hypothetical protein